MHPATNAPAFGCRERLTRTRQQPKGKANMSAKALTACSFEPAAERTVATDHQAPEGIAAEIQFREDLWREYRIEAINAGFSTAHATEYASALSPEMGLVAGVSGLVPVGRGWFYQSRTSVTNRTVTSGLITLARWETSKATWRTGAAGASVLGRRLRWWNVGGRS
jgi:hypothetical protein